MGDHRASIKVEFKLPNKTYRMNWGSVNYWPDDNGIDSRVREFFEESWDDYKSWYNDLVTREHREQHKAEIEAQERRQLAELQAKYANEK